MITAAEARAIVETSKTRIDAVVERLSEKIREASEGEKREYICTEDKLHDSVEFFHHLSATKYQLAVMERLKSLGFDVKWMKHGEAYIPRALQNDDGTGPSYSSWAVIIKW